MLGSIWLRFVIVIRTYYPTWNTIIISFYSSSHGEQRRCRCDTSSVHGSLGIRFTVRVLTVHSIDCHFIFIWLLPIAIPFQLLSQFPFYYYYLRAVQHHPSYTAWLTESIVQFGVLTFHKNVCVLLRDIISISSMPEPVARAYRVQMNGKQWIPMRVLDIIFFFFWPIAFEYLMRLRSAGEMLSTRSEYKCSEAKSCQLKISHLLIAVRNGRTWNRIQIRRCGL